MGKNVLRDGETIAAALLAGLGVYIFIQSRAWDYYTEDGPGPGFFPSWYGVAMVVLSLALIVTRLRKGSATAARVTDWNAVHRALGTWLAFAATVALMGTLGFVVSFALLTFVIVTVIFRRPPITATLTAIGVAAAFHLTFPVILGVALPTGFLGF